MRASLIVGGLVLMFVSVVLFVTVFFLFYYGIICGVVGLIMLLAGLSTSPYQPRP